jgi:hypothetical protein
MAVVKIKFAPSHRFMIGKGAVDAVRKELTEGKYAEESELFVVDGDSQDAAEEVYDLTNNPSRCHERFEKYGIGRSLSTGDIVVVGEEQWVCMSFGWAEV